MPLFTVNMPDIGEGVVEGEVIEWLKNRGDTITQDEPILVLMTDKATVELPAPYPGRLAKQYYKAGEIATKGLPLYDIEVATEIILTPSHSAAKTSNICTQKEAPQTNQESESPSGKFLATPPTRHLARTMGIDLNTVKPTGKDGRITIHDLKQHSRASDATFSPITTFPDDELIPLIGIKKRMADKMHESIHQAAHFSYFEEVDATRLVQIRQNIKKEAEKTGINLTYMPFFIRALSLALKNYPLLNSSLDTKTSQIHVHQPHNIGIGMSTEYGLIVPVLKGVEKMSLEEIIRSYESLKEKAKAHQLLPQEMKDSTITISNYGALGGGKWATPVLNYPEVAILAVARIHKQPAIKNETIVARDTLNLSWSFDHRLIDGDLAATFSHFYATLLENPMRLV